MHLLRYTFLRLLMLAASVGLLYFLGLRSWLLWGLGIVVAALLSYLLLPRQRDQAALDIARTVERRKTDPKPDADATYEDAVIDSAGTDSAQGSGEAGEGVKDAGVGGTKEGSGLIDGRADSGGRHAAEDAGGSDRGDAPRHSGGDDPSRGEGTQAS